MSDHAAYVLVVAILVVAVMMVLGEPDLIDAAVYRIGGPGLEESQCP